MTVGKLRNKINELIAAIIPLAEAHPCEGKRTELLAVMEGTLRKNIMRIQAINLLCGEEKMANSAFELTRNMIEDVISVEYVLASKDPELSAHKFYEFRWVQLKEDLDYYRDVGVEVNVDDFPDTETNIEKEYARVISGYKDFTDKEGKPVRSWARKDVEMMLGSLKKKGVLPEGQIRTVLRTYVDGSRKTHFNPVELLAHMEQDVWDHTSQGSQKLALLVSSSSLVRLSTRYIDLISKINGKNTHHDIAAKANAFLNELHATEDIDV
ncbi:MAG: DUF5677 domain-containing protein [Candidatus Saccharibacteria bacterium]|nr:DUF5677 domain-containing protein [Candidatus Saccharibacteria bacterium]